MSIVTSSGLARNRRAVVLGVVGLTGLVVLFSLVRVTGGGGDPYAGLGAITPGPAGGASSLSTVPAPIVETAGSTAPADGHPDDSATPALRDPFCPLMVSQPTGGTTSCPEQVPSILGQPMTLLDVFVDHHVPHARVRIVGRTLTLHVGESFGLYTIASLSGDCGEFVRGALHQEVCTDQVWTGTGELPMAIS